MGRCRRYLLRKSLGYLWRGVRLEICWHLQRYSLLLQVRGVELGVLFVGVQVVHHLRRLSLPLCRLVEHGTNCGRILCRVPVVLFVVVKIVRRVSLWDIVRRVHLLRLVRIGGVCIVRLHWLLLCRCSAVAWLLSDLLAVLDLVRIVRSLLLLRLESRRVVHIVAEVSCCRLLRPH